MACGPIMLIQVPAAGPRDDYSPMFEAHHTPMPVPAPVLPGHGIGWCVGLAQQ
jgi:hypothetical protein